MEWQRCIAHAGGALIGPASSAVRSGGAITSWKCSAKQEAQAAGRDEDGQAGWGAAGGLSAARRDAQCSSARDSRVIAQAPVALAVSAR
jgi:hypothetical protein